MSFTTLFMTILMFFFPWLNMETQPQPQEPEIVPPVYVESAPGLDDDSIIEVGDDYAVSCQNPAIQNIAGRLVETRGDKFVVEVSGTYTGTSTLYAEADGINTRLHVSSNGNFRLQLEISAGAEITVDTF